MPNSRLYFGTATVPPGNDSIILELVTLEASQIASKQISLSETPVNISNITAWVVNGSTFVPGVDFTLTANIVDFSISSYAPVLAVGNAIQFIYKKV